MVKHKKKNPQIVVYNNNYIEAFYQTDYLAKKIMVASSLRCRDLEWKPEGCQVVMSSNELRDIVGIKKSSLQHLEHAVKKLTETSVTVKNPDKPKDWKIFNFLPKGEYKDGVLTLLINNDMKPFVLDLQKNFTQYSTENVRYLKSGHSIRLFELLKMYSYKGYYRVKVDELKKMFCVENKYRNYAHFKQFVIDKAQEEMQQYCDIGFEVREIKTGNKVTELEFTIFKQAQRHIEEEGIYQADLFDVEVRPIPAQPPAISELGQKLIKLGFIGDPEKFIQEEGRELIEATLKAIEATSGVNNAIGVLRDRLKALKLQKQLLKQEEEAKKEKEEADRKLSQEQAIIDEAIIKASEKRDLENDANYSGYLPEFYEYCSVNSFNDFLKDDFINEFKQKYALKGISKFSDLGGVLRGCFLEWFNTKRKAD